MTFQTSTAPSGTEATMSILLLGDGWFPDEPGGLNRYVRELHEVLSRTREVYTLVLGPVSDRPRGVIVAARRRDPLAIRLARFSAAASAAGRNADVVDAHFPLYAVLPAVFHAFRRGPLVAHFHGPWAEESRADGKGALNAAAKHLIERSLYRRAAEVIVLSGAFKRTIVERYGVRPWNVNVVPPGVDLDRFSPGHQLKARADLGIPATAWTALCVRRLVPRMGLDVLLDAWSRIRDEKERVLLVAGDGPSRADLEARVERLGLDDVVFLGRVSEADLVACYRAADVCVVPSLALEGFGLVVLEALACGTPVIATEVGGIPEVIGRLDRSLLVAPGDVSRLKERLISAREQPTALPSASACRTYATSFSWRTAASRHCEIYERARNGGRPRRIRVVYLSHTARLAGAELALLRLLPALHDVDAHVVLAEDGPLVARLLEAGISAEVLPMREAARGLRRKEVRVSVLPLASIFGSGDYVARVASRLRRLRPDLVHTNSLKSGMYGSVAAAIVRLPVIWHVREPVTADQLPTEAVRLVRAMASRIPSAVVADTRATLASLGRAAMRGTVIPSPIAYDELVASRRPPDGSRALSIGMVGRLAPLKGQDVFLRAFARAFPNGCERATVIGAPLFGEEDYARSLRELASRLGLGSRLEFKGFREDVPEELASIDALVHASVVPEALGQVVLEGMAAALPVVVPAVGGPAEVVEDGVTGLLYPPGDVGALADALVRLRADADLRSRLGEAARREARRYAPDVIAPQVVSLYRQVLSRRGEVVG